MHDHCRLLYILLASVTACAAEPAPDVDAARDAPDADMPAAAVNCNDLPETLLTSDATRQALAAAYGVPDSVIPATEPNRHIPDATDSLFAVYYPGLVVGIRTPPSARDLVSSVAVEDNRYLEHTGIGIGVRVADVTAALGEPSERSAAALVYNCSDVVEQPVTFVLQDDVVARIEVEYYVD